jgi:outer membrane protein OmpA-like peptidoglycan-associated protein
VNHILSTLFIALLLAGSLRAQDTDAPKRSGDDAEPGRLISTTARLGLYGGYGFNFHDTQADLFSGGGECGAFNSGQGNGFNVGLFGEMPVVGDWIDVVLGVGYAQRGGKFGEVHTGGLPILDPNSGGYVELERKHSYTADLPYILGEIGVKITPLEEYPIYVRVGGAVASPMSGASHKQTEEILSPSGVLYPETNTAVRDVSSGPITDVGLLFHATGAIGYPLPLGPRLTASPEVRYYYPLNDVTPHYRWRIATAEAGVAFRMSFGRMAPPSTPPPPTTPDAPLAATESPSAILSTVSAQKIEIVETVVTETFPILPYIFFDSASTEIAPRYVKIEQSQTTGFNEQALPHRSLAAYYEMLNIVGSRLARDRGVKITLNGTTDGRESTIPGAMNNLARARAQGVKDYLVKVWGVDPTRIAITTSTAPTYPSSMQYAEGAEENRRVEITSTNDQVLQPIIFERFNEHSITPRQITFAPTGASNAGVEGWRLDVVAGDRNVWHTEGAGKPPATVTWNLDVETAARLARELRGDGTIRCELTVNDYDGKVAQSEFRQPARKEMSPFEVSRLSLIVFDFDKADINTQNRRMISSFVARSLQSSSTSSIIGSTDKLGELAHNQQLSEARAVAVRDLILAERPTAQITKVEGVGPSRLLYDNSTPEGRYYCRTVTVEVRTPIEDMKP